MSYSYPKRKINHIVCDPYVKAADKIEKTA